MMLSILVCHSYFLRFDHKQLERGKPYPPLATLQVASMLRKAGHKVSFFDSMLAEGLEEYNRRLVVIEPDLVLFYEDTFNFLSKMCLDTMRRAACDMIGAAQRGGARVIAAGPDVSDAPGPYLRAGADVALIGEGLSALLELLSRLETQPDVRCDELCDGVPGVASLNHGKIVTSTGARVLPIPHYDGFAAWDLVDMDRYRAMWLKTHGYFSLNMAGSRGCSFRCAWCAKPTWGNHYLQRSADDVAMEMAHLKRSFDPQHVWFADDIFGFRVEWIAAFALAAQAAGGVVPFTIQTRADLIGEPMAQALKQAGCREVWLGAESGSQRVLDAMNKGTTVAEIRTARDRLRAAGIRVGFFIQLGYMGEQLADILATRELLEVARPDEIGVSVSYPLPGTKFYELVKAQLGSKTHWKESDDLEMLFEGTYTTDFYRSIRNLLHDQISLQSTSTSDGIGGKASCNPPAGAAHALESRWQDLLAREEQYRSPPRRPTASLSIVRG
jgi:anaerobic magnesium-protoporphyrin IX monomethyl ester cyclase